MDKYDLDCRYYSLLSSRILIFLNSKETEKSNIKSAGKSQLVSSRKDIISVRLVLLLVGRLHLRQEYGNAID